MPLTPEDVRNKQFTTVRLREGYDEDEVDAFLDEVEAELTRLLRENEDLRAKLAAATRAAAQNQGGAPQMRKGPEPQDQRPGLPAAISGPQPVPPHQQQQTQAMPQMGGQPQLPGPGGPGRGPGMPGMPGQQPQLAGPQGHGGPGGPMGPGHQPQHPQHPQQPQPHPMGGPVGPPQGFGGQPQQGPGGDSAARVLALAQQTADQAVQEARSEANKIIGEARSRAEGLERDARAKADALERDAQEKHRVAMGSLESARATLERKVEDLKSFEREYRTRLKSYLDSQLRALESQADDSLAPPRQPSVPASLPAGNVAQMNGGGTHGGQSFGGANGVGTLGGQSLGGQSLGGQSLGGQQQLAPGQGAPGQGGHTHGGPVPQPMPAPHPQQAPAPAMTQPMAPIRPQAPQPMQQVQQGAPTPMRGFLIDEDPEN
ncbi:cell division protein DivIVA [Mangrovactinospora gilvigrisea]|uniref:Cell wall synthesis protein Wag31 n=1 Tax=Mangrovactinospora gilvigrisea TaxID=1428644 RepID=A0A1J7BHH8_9ACTN|nr:DivIVA domain-containing protein [Mangrovactinospora gilvigrisea]OIV38155.1 cell division protein DivIVA [Mangrovactinospora gilvigrisea]